MKLYVSARGLKGCKEMHTQTRKPAGPLRFSLGLEWRKALPDPLEDPIHARLWGYRPLPAHRSPYFEFPGPAKAEMKLLSTSRRFAQVQVPTLATLHEPPHCRGGGGGGEGG